VLPPSVAFFETAAVVPFWVMCSVREQLMLEIERALLVFVLEGFFALRLAVEMLLQRLQLVF
jgi:hypothetical protein